MTNYDFYKPYLYVANQVHTAQSLSKDKSISWRQRNKASSRYIFSASKFEGMIKKLITRALNDGTNPQTLRTSFIKDLDAMYMQSAESFQPVVILLRDTLVRFVDKDQKKSALRRSIEAKSNMIVTILFITFLIHLKIDSAVEVTQPISTPQGIIQRAEAFHKDHRYRNFAYRTYGNHKSLSLTRAFVMLPVMPSDEETAYGNEFLSATQFIYNHIAKSGYKCAIITPNQLKPENMAEDIWDYFDDTDNTTKIASIKTPESLIALAITEIFDCVR